MIEAKQVYANYYSTLVAVKGLDRERKHENDLERI